MLSVQTTERLREVGLQANSAEDFSSGLKLLQLVCQVYYQGHNPTLASKLKWSDDQKTGNKVVNINMILNFIKKDPAITLPPAIRELSAFRLIEEPDAMVSFVQFLLCQMPAQSKIEEKASIEMSPPRQQENQFENLYFVGSIDKAHYHSDDSLEGEKGETVVRKGSFKVLKPKTASQSKLKSSDSKQLQEDKPKIDYRMEPLKEMYILENENRGSSSDDQQDELQIRKTIPKKYQKPPLCRSRQKETNELKERHCTDEKQTPMVTASQTDRQTIIKNIENISSQIAEEEKSLHLLNSSLPTKPNPPKPQKQRSSRKIFKMDLPQLPEAKKKALAEWLIGINILALSAAKHALSLHSICKDGVIFMEVINYYRGRGKNLCFFREPKRSAELHSNYQKLFSLLQEMPEFRSDLLGQYEYFVPEAQPNAFWGLLSSIHACFNRERTKAPAIERYQNSVGKAVERSTSRKKRNSESVSYQELKFNAESIIKSKERQDLKSNFSSIEIPRKETPQPLKNQQSQKSQKSKSEESEKCAPYGLVQRQQPPAEDNSRTERGYKELYLCKFKNLQTPSKNRSFSNTSLSRSRLRSSAESARKQEAARSTPPSITLEMQMAVLKYLGGVAAEEQEELFKDPFRNGILLCSVLKKEWGVDCFASRRPRSIDDCRNNFLTAIEVIRSRRKELRVAYEYFVEELVKGEKSLLYGLIWSVIREESPQPQPQMTQQAQVENRQGEEERVGWVRAIEKHSADIAVMKIRSEEALYSAILHSDFLFHYATFLTGKRAITPNYERAFNAVQRESNLKKALSYFVQLKIIRSDYVWRCKALLKREGSLLQELISDLMAHFHRLFKKEQLRTVNFVRYMRPHDQQHEPQEKPQEKLETTMANQTLLQPVPPSPPLEVNWMRKLGFSGSLELNDGVLLCRVIAKLGMKTVQGVNEHPQSRAECLGNIRRAIKHLARFKWDEYDIAEADPARCLEVYAFLRQHYKHSYALKTIL